MRARIHLPKPAWLLKPGTPAWPAALEQLARPPAELHVAGELPDFTRAVAVVGTRHADADALGFARRLASELAERGAVIVSGGAEGIDAEAHRGALEVGGQTVAVLATGVVQAYPRHHAPLFAEIASSGSLLSEFDRPSGGAGWSFLQRNRLIAALANIVVVVQAPARSGALSTARWAKSLKRRLLIVPSAPWDPRGTGCLELLRQGTEICTSAADILSLAPFRLRELPKSRRVSEKNLNDDATLEASERAVWQTLRRGACHPDQISATLDMPVAEVQEALLTLVLRGFCQRRGDGSYTTRR